jgi:hypothetical protein
MTTEPVDEIIVEDEPAEAEPYVAYEIASYPADLTLAVIEDMWKREEIAIPDFQRNFVWDIRQSSLLIESFLLGLPIPQVFFYTDEENRNLIIDGQQRILSILYYFEGFFGSESIQGKKQVFRLTGLDERSPFHNKRYEDLDDSIQRKLRSAVLRAVMIRQLQPTKDSTSIYHIFERLNTGGTPLKPQEIRNCVFRGHLVEILRTLNADKNWRRILGKSNFDKHQKDVELILRILSLYRRIDHYEKPMKEFLNNTMSRLKHGDSPHVKEFAHNFTKLCKVIVDELGDKPFHVRGPLNTSVLDSVFCTLLEHVGKLPKDLANRWTNLKANQDFSTKYTFYGTSDAVIVKARFRLARVILIG